MGEQVRARLSEEAKRVGGSGHDAGRRCRGAGRAETAGRVARGTVGVDSGQPDRAGRTGGSWGGSAQGSGGVEAVAQEAAGQIAGGGSGRRSGGHVQRRAGGGVWPGDGAVLGWWWWEKLEKVAHVTLPSKLGWAAALLAGPRAVAPGRPLAPARPLVPSPGMPQPEAAAEPKRPGQDCGAAGRGGACRWARGACGLGSWLVVSIRQAGHSTRVNSERTQKDIGRCHTMLANPPTQWAGDRLRRHDNGLVTRSQSTPRLLPSSPSTLLTYSPTLSTRSTHSLTLLCILTPLTSFTLPRSSRFTTMLAHSLSNKSITLLARRVPPLGSLHTLLCTFTLLASLTVLARSLYSPY